MLNGKKTEQDIVLETLIPVGKYVVSKSPLSYDAPSKRTPWKCKAPYHCVYIGGEKELLETRECKKSVLKRQKEIKRLKLINKVKLILGA